MSDKSFLMLPRLINGGIAGIAGIGCCFPLDLVKVRLQSQKIGPNGEREYNSMFDCFKKTFKSEGLRGMYRGSSVNLVFITPERAIKLTANDLYRYLLRAPDGTLSLPRQMLAGSMVGVTQTFILTPMELLKIQMQTSGAIIAKAKAEGRIIPPPSGLSLAKDMIRQHGFLGMYTGVRAGVSRDITFCLLYFPTFATLNDLGPKRNDGTGTSVFYWSFLSGMVSASMAGLCATPFDCIKTRLQLKGQTQYSGFGDAVTQILKNEGPRAFYKGGACRMIVLAPLFGITQTVYYLGVAEYLLNFTPYSKYLQ